MSECVLSYTELRTVEFDVHVDKDGNIVTDSLPETLDSFESSIWCSECGLVGYDEYEAHGISEDWEVM